MLMRLRFKIPLSIILLLIVLCVSLRISYGYINLKNNDGPIIVVDGNITVSYLNGNEFSLKNDGKFEFSVTNNSDEMAYYYIQMSDVKAKNETVSYEIKSDDNEVNVNNSLKSEIVSNNIAIEGNKTDNYVIEFKSNTEDIYSGKISIGVKQEKNNYFADTILANSQIKNEAVSELGNVSATDEGLIKTTDDLGQDVYYFRGNVINNYVSFANYTWRIIKINGDGSVKLVLNSLIDVLSSYYEGEDFTYNNSKIEENLNTWYESKLENYSDYIANYKFCNDLVKDANDSAYTAYNRIVVDKIPTFVCLGTNVNKKIGLLTADEVILAGGSLDANESYYLYNSEIKTDYYTMTSARFNGKYYPFIVKTNGSISYETNGTLIRGSRPVINIIRNIKVSGNGTVENPYTLEIN